MKKICSLLLVAALFVSSLTACSSSNQTKGNSNAGSNSSSESKVPQDDMTKSVSISFMGWQGTPIGEITENAKKWLNQKYNVDISIMTVASADYTSKLNVLLASNNAPDVYFNASGMPLTELYNQGTVPVIDLELINAYMPNYKKMIETFSPKAWNKYKVEGKLVSIPNFQVGPYYGLGNAWRADLFEEAGVAKLPSTIAECEDAFAKFKAKFPNKYIIGGDKSYKMQFADFVFGAFGIIPYDTAIRNNQIVYTSVQPEIKEALKVLSAWYKKGYIDPECFTDDGAAKDTKYINGTTAIMTGRGWQAFNPTSDTTFYAKTAKQNPNAKQVVNHQVSGPNGKVGNASFMAVVGEMDANVGVGLGKQVEKDAIKMIRILKMLEAMATDEETLLICGQGKLGVNYEKNSDGTLKRIGNDTAFKTGGGEFFASFVTAPQEFHNKYMPPVTKEFLDKNFKDKKFYNNLTRQITIQPEASVTYSAELGKIESEYIISTILGKESVDNFDKYVDKWKKAGGEQATKALNEMYKVDSDGIHIIMK